MPQDLNNQQSMRGTIFMDEMDNNMPPPSLREGYTAMQNASQVGKVDPNGLDQHEPGAKLDYGKPDTSLLLMFGKALIAVAEVGTFGAAKYTRGGWLDVEDGITRYTAALLRHVFAEDTEPMDPDSGLYHDAHAAWNALARLELRLREGDVQ